MAKDIIKNIPLTLDINARKRLNGTVDISLYSKDIATGQFEFTFIDEDGDPVVLDETYSAQALVKYESGSKTYLNDMIIEGNIIRFIFPHDFITKDGTITMYIYITKDNYTSDVAAISFPVFVSEIDKDLDPSISVHYIGKIEQLIEDMKNEMSSYQVDVDEVIKGYEESISKLQALETDYEPQLTSLTAQLAQKADKSEMGAPTQEQVNTWLDANPDATTTVQDGAINNLKLADKAVSVDKTDFLESEIISNNLINPNTIITGYSADSNTGVLTVNATRNISDLIKVEPNTTYYVAYSTFIFEYDSQGGYIGFVDAATITTTSNTYMVRVRETASESRPMFFSKTNVYDQFELGTNFVNVGTMFLTENQLEQIGSEFPSINESEKINDELYIYNAPIILTANNTIGNKLWSQTDNLATLNNQSNYISLDRLIEVEPGATLKLRNWGVINGDTQFAYAGYTDNSEPYGTNGRINFSAGTYNADTNTYTFKIPSTVRKIGLSMQVLDGFDYTQASAIIGDEVVTFSDSMINLVNSAVNSTVDVSLDTTSSYLKGASPKRLDKKIGIISAGQSNIDGRVPIAELPSYLTLPMSNINYASNYSPSGANGVFQTPLLSSHLSSNRWGFDLVTYYHLTQVANQEIFVMKWSQGATSIDPTGTDTHHWTVDYEDLEGIDKSLLLSFESLIRACVATRGDEFDIKAMVWHQGEGDNYRQSQIASDNYYYNLKQLIAYCRGVVGNSRLPFITGTISHASAQYDKQIEDAILRIAKEDDYVWVVDMSRAGLRDAYHFNASWNEYLGKKIYDCLIDAGVVDAIELNPSEPI